MSSFGLNTVGLIVLASISSDKYFFFYSIPHFLGQSWWHEDRKEWCLHRKKKWMLTKKSVHYFKGANYKYINMHMELWMHKMLMKKEELVISCPIVHLHQECSTASLIWVDYILLPLSLIMSVLLVACLLSLGFICLHLRFLFVTESVLRSVGSCNKEFWELSLFHATFRQMAFLIFAVKLLQRPRPRLCIEFIVLACKDMQTTWGGFVKYCFFR